MRNRYLHKRAASPLANIGKGALIGTGIGALLDIILNNKKREAENYRWWKHPLVYAALGSLPGLVQASVQYGKAYTDSSNFKNLPSSLDSKLHWLDPLTMDNEQLKEKSPVYRTNVKKMLNDLTDYFDIEKTDYDDPANKPEKSLDKKFKREKAAALYKAAIGWNTPNVPVNAFNQSIFNTPGMNQNAMTNIPNTLNATQTMTGAPWVSPAQIAGTLVNAGIGSATGAVIGKTIGALCGISPQTYNTIKNMGMYAGMMNTMGNTIARY